MKICIIWQRRYRS